MSDQEFEQAKAEFKVRAKELHKAARIIAADGQTINKYWIEDFGSVTKEWEKCVIKFRVKDASSYSEWVEIILNDGTILLSTYDYISSGGNTEFEVYTFRNGAWVERFITYSKEGVIAEQERKKKAELAEKLKPFQEIDF